MRKTVSEAEKNSYNDHEDFEISLKTNNEDEYEKLDQKRLFFKNALFMADENNVNAIIICSKNGINAHLIAWNRPNQHVFYVVDSDKTYHTLHHLYGIKALKSDLSAWVNGNEIITTLMEHKRISTGDKVMIITDWEEFSNNAGIKITEIK